MTVGLPARATSTFVSPLEGIRCPECLENEKFALQMTLNVVMERDGIDFMGHQPEDDAFPGRVIDPEEGLRDEDPIACLNMKYSCTRTGSIFEFKLGW